MRAVTRWRRSGGAWLVVAMSVPVPFACTGPAVPAGSHDPDPGASYAFVGVDVVMLAGGARLVEDQTVVVGNGRIEAVGPRSDVVVSTGTERIDGAGRYLIPGLADMHVHLERFDDPAVLDVFVANGVTTVRNMDGRPYILDWRERVAAGALAGPRIYTAGPILEGDRPVWDDTRIVGSAGEARDAVVEQARAGYDFIKVYHTLSAAAYRATIGAAHERGLPVAGHVPIPVGLDGVLDAGQASIEHLEGYDDAVEADDSPFRGRWHWSKLYMAMPVDSTKARRAAERTASVGVWNVPTLLVKDRFGSLDAMDAWLDAPETAYVPARIRERWDPRNGDEDYYERLRSFGEEEARILEAGTRHRALLVRALHGSGAPLLVGTDTPNPFVVPGFSVHQELAAFVRAGMTPGAALAAATREAARFVGALGEWGTIQPGRWADLVLLDANPLESIRNTTAIAGVMVRGVWISNAERRAMLEQVAASYR